MHENVWNYPKLCLHLVYSTKIQKFQEKKKEKKFCKIYEKLL